MAKIKELKPQEVTIRYLGKGFFAGNKPRREHTLVGGEKFYNYRAFKEQNDDLSYTRPLSFYERNKDILSNRKLFIVEFVNAKGEVMAKNETVPNIPSSVALSKELEAKGVEFADGHFVCPIPTCRAAIPAIGDANAIMSVHLLEHGIEV